MKDEKTFEGRLEFFGSLFWNFNNKKILAFDKKTTDILKRILNNNYNGNLEGADFIKKCEHIGLIKNSKPNYYFVKDRSNSNGFLSAPIRVHYAITSVCNLNCKHCFTRNILNVKKKELVFNAKIRILDNMVDLGVREMLISGGEPFACPEIINFLKEGIKRNISLKVFSNGFLLNQQIIDQLKDIPIDYLAISIDGATEYSFQQVRGAQSFQKLKDIIKSLSKQCVFPIVMQITVSKINYSDMENYFKIVIDSGIKRIKIRALKPGGEILNNPLIMISFGEYIKFCKKAERLFREGQYEKKYGISLDCTIGNIRLAYDNSEMALENIPQTYCGFGCVGARMTMFIDPFGYVHPCAFIDNFLDKNMAVKIRGKNLKEIWDSSSNMKTMRNLKGNTKCISCELYNLCRGGCRARATYYSKRHDINSRDGWCPTKLKLKIKK